ncbi:ferritin-like domain-containing protein [Oharaeibacter diazotrophicus]|uniref:Ferritin-like protein n=2 Tax=Oharaeibacter diazotrophicus TaxID=1920512 RepID=A0A4R6RJ05_9HYPH|nr:ferritin-like domain-containing protein [Oharaeibacter diazotrophicus]TDP86420.1 ferritin-like protein [Oharaeibacter diazotrophicus]BBE71637.1 hypothetical protein OHA_1_01219 [Pleomorphomonas sp. SM30]GLS78402.1 hypothetical protein GCM10007904_37390 [Oharaeibacter diazotrophicus]
MNPIFDRLSADPAGAAARLDAGRRAFLRASGLAAASGVALGTGLVGTGEAEAAVSDADVLNFALNLEYLEAEFYLRAVFGEGLGASDVTGRGAAGAVTGGREVVFKDAAIKAFAAEIARDEHRHVQFLRKALGDAKVARPAINLTRGFDAAARAAGLVPADGHFDVFGSDDNFLLGAFLFEDVGVTAYKGAAALLTDKAVLSAAAGILAVEAYHAGEIRLMLLQRGLDARAAALSDARDAVDGSTDLDQPVRVNRLVNVVPTDGNGIAYGRTPQQVLGIVYVGGEANRYGFFPNRMNGAVR